MHKLHVPPPGDGPPWIHPSTFAIEHLAGSSRITAGSPGNARVFERLTACLLEPYLLLYVLHTPRGEADAGRYQSEPLSGAEFRALVARFGRYFAGDARFDLWVHSPADGSTIVWDRHDLIHAYGPLERFTLELERLGYIAGEVGVPVPHIHHYREEFDADAAELLASRDWSWTPLLPEDEQ